MIALAVVAAVVLLGRALAEAYADYLWYESVGAAALWRARLGAVALLRVGSGAAAAAFAFVNLYAVRRSVVSLVFPRRLANLEIGEEVPGRYLIIAALGLSLVLGVLLAMPADQWTSAILAGSGRPFNEGEGYFNQDLSFYVYWLPMENALWMWAFVTVLVVAASVVLLYALTPSLRWHRGGVYASAYVRRHFTMLVGVLLFMLAWSFRLDMYSLIIDGSGPDGAFSWADHKVGVPGDFLLSLLTLGAALVVLWTGFVGRLRLAAISVMTIVVLSLVIREAAPAIAARTGSDADRRAREAPYLAVRAAYTRRAFGVDAMPRADSVLPFPSAAAAAPWVSVWDGSALARTLDGARAAGDAAPSVTWRASQAGIVADVIDAPRPGSLDTAPWEIARFFAADADERGAPVRAPAPTADATPAGSAGPAADALDESAIVPPLVYPGAADPKIVADSLNRVTGTLLESFAARFAAAWSMQKFELLSGDLPQPRPTVIAHRDVRDRVEAYAPFFTAGRRVDPVLIGDSLYWSLDLYATSYAYPLSRHSLILGEDRSYFHHAATAIVQASTGEVFLVADSTLGPIAASWKARIPSLFTTWNALPRGIRELIPPPIDALEAQAAAFGRYGTRTDSGPPRTVPIHTGADSALIDDPTPIAFPGARGTAITIPLIDDGDRIRGVLIGVGGGTSEVAWYPIAAPGPRWTAVLDRLRSVDSAGPAGREAPIVHGQVRAVPVRGGVAFFEPSYRWRSPNAPALERVALVVGDTTGSFRPPLGVAAATTGAAPSSARPAPSAGSNASLVTLYQTMRDALRRGDFAAFGRAFDALGKALGANSSPR
jgi:uncharacterized membrane protein (UPF0182 family)